jgi:hypothetical protein
MRSEEQCTPQRSKKIAVYRIDFITSKTVFGYLTFLGKRAQCYLTDRFETFDLKTSSTNWQGQ